MSSNPVFVLDNGASTIKSGFASCEKHSCIPNCKMKVKSERQRQYLGDQIDDCKDCSGLFYILPHQKGFITNWDIQREVWEYLFTKKNKDIEPQETDIIVTEPYFNFRNIQNNIDEVLFEEYGFKSVLRTNTGYLSSINHRFNNDKIDSTTDLPTTDDTFPLACLVVDSGFSFTHIAPYVYSEKLGYELMKGAVRRIDIGGKALTNHLKEIISYRQMNVMDETYVINQCKEDICFVALDFKEKLNECEQSKQNKIARDYILPDYTNVRRGYVRKPDWRATNRVDANSTDPQFVRLANERFQVPEILFCPSDVGINQVGVVEAIVDSISSLPKKIQPFLYSNIVLTGGNANIPGFKERVERGVRSYCPNNYVVDVFLSDDPTSFAWYGGKRLVNVYSNIFKNAMMTKKQYDESGDNKKLAAIK